MEVVASEKLRKYASDTMIWVLQRGPKAKDMRRGLAWESPEGPAWLHGDGQEENSHNAANMDLSLHPGEGSSLYHSMPPPTPGHGALGTLCCLRLIRLQRNFHALGVK